ncbi:hypothetical protein SteCoe_21649 [Stentor coeruleus]|uniref:Uncharacterized protein n=1 Tax=Stentor coeruleus TaxID=5963 RepID=A0A1R2BP02_9CILI|nr:hypothetical protein SteCoe_21649 [Stentor coeruleus]
MTTNEPVYTVIDEFKESLLDFTRTLKAVKAQHSLKNHHAKFKNHLRKKLSETHEKKCSQIINPACQETFTVRNFELLPLIYSYYNTGLALKVPLTLCLSPKHNFLVKYKKTMNILKGKNILMKFFKSLKIIPGYPVCIFKSFENKNKFFMSLESVKVALKSENAEYGYYQEFIKPTGGKASIMISHAKNSCYSKNYLVHNNDFIPKSSEIVEDWDLLQISPTPNENLPQYLKEELDRIKKIRVSRSNIERQSSVSSMLRLERLYFSKNTNSTLKHLQSKKTFESNAVNYENLFIVNPKNVKCLSPYEIKIPIQEVEVMNQTLFSFLSHEYKKKYKKDLEELHIIYIKDQDRGWYFVKIDSLKFYQQKKPKAINKSVIIKSRITPASELEEIHLPSQTTTSQSIESSFSTSIINNPKIRIRQFSTIKAKSCFQPSSSETNLLGQKKIKLIIDRAALKYDILTKASKMCSEDMMKFEKKYGSPSIWAPTAVKIHKNLVKSPLQPLFVGFNREKLKNYETSIERLLCCKIDMQYKREMHLFHKGFKISNLDYDLYREIFTRCIRKVVKDQSDFEMIMINFDSLREFIVEID